MAARSTRRMRFLLIILLLSLTPDLLHARENRQRPRRPRSKPKPRVQVAPYSPLSLLPGSRIQLGDHCPSWGAEVSEQTKGISAVDRVEITGEGQHEATQLQRTCFTVRVVATGGVNATFDQGCQQRAYFRLLISSPHPTSLPKGTHDPSGIRLAGKVEYIPSTSTHEACYTIAPPGEYVALIFLDFTNVFVLTSHNPNCCIPERGRQRNLVKATLKITVHPSSTPLPDWPREKLPWCSPPLLAASSNQGHWRGNHWEPASCQRRELEPAEILEGLRGKSLLMVGDSQIRYIAAELMALVAARSRTSYAQKWKSNLKSTTTVLQKHSLSLWGPYLRSRDLIAVTRFGPNTSFNFYGSFWEGYGHFVNPSFNLTYIAHKDARAAVVPDWMVDTTVMEGHVATRFAPFDLALTSTGLHDISTVALDLFETNLKRHYLPGILKLMRDKEGVTFTSILASEDVKKPVKFVARSNNPRATIYEHILQTVVRGEGILNWLDLREMTVSRLDMCKDSTHYGWAMSLTIIDLWLGSQCGKATPPLM